MAKSALSDMGIKLDHIIINNGNIEVGKKIGKKTTVIYIDGEIPTVKVKYEHTSHLESVVSANEQSQSYDIVYKNDYENIISIMGIGQIGAIALLHLFLKYRYYYPSSYSYLIKNSSYIFYVS